MDENNMFENQNGQEGYSEQEQQPADQQGNSYQNDGYQQSNPYQNDSYQQSNPYQNDGYQQSNPYQNESYQQNNPYQNDSYQQNNPYQGDNYQQNNPYQGNGGVNNPYQNYNSPYQQYQPYNNTQPYNDSQLDLEEPVKMGEWLLSLIVLMIPCVNIIMMFVWAFSNTEKKSKSNFFKAYLIYFAIVFVLMMLFSFATVFTSSRLYY